MKLDLRMHNKDGRHTVDPMGWRDYPPVNIIRAAENRDIIARKLYIEAYLLVEAMLERYPLTAILPERFYGSLPQAGGDGSRHEPFTKTLKEDDEEKIYGG